MKINYETINGAICVTQCPFSVRVAESYLLPDAVGGAPAIAAVGSLQCKMCKFHVASSNHIVECSHT